MTETKLLGTYITSDLKWDLNTNNLVKKAYSRMEILRKLSSFSAPEKDMKQIYMTYIRSLCEQSCTVWHSSLTNQNEEDIERVQKVALKIILKEKYKSYENALNRLDLNTLKQRRQTLCLNFARKCLKSDKMKKLFPPNNKNHEMKSRNPEHFKVFFSHTERLKNSPVIYMQNLLNNEVTRKQEQDKIWS